MTTMLGHLDDNERRGVSPETVAATIVKAIEAARPREFYAVGSRSPLPFLLKRALPRSVVSRIIASQHGLKR
ncbi:hypothetical protein [Brevibacterium aurantiacum]|uniref:hypothetical protein n=1 Tax=Brevibacterium aurantiacum TaxID=273384 RepID=UPI0021B2573C|nr:hypothetical protein [Brevibacterium aurantiacum]